MRIRPTSLAAAPAVLAAAALAVLVAAAGPAAADDFGTAPVTGAGVRADGTGVAVRAVTVGRHAGFDRVVFTAEAGLPRWELRYVPGVTQDASGTPIPLDGAADLYLVFRGTAWGDHPSPPQSLAPRYTGLRQVSSAGEFEGDLSYGIGQATRAGFRAFTLTGPNRLVVDVAHPAGSAASPSPSPSPSPSGPTASGSTASGSTASGSTDTAGGPAGSAAGTPEPAAAGGGPGGSVTDAGSGRTRTALLIGGGLVLLGVLTGAAVLVQTRRSP